jgi:hypothetical protein
MCVTVTVAPGIDPLLSETIPLTDAVVTPCACTFLAVKNVMLVNNNKSKYFLILFV